MGNMTWRDMLMRLQAMQVDELSQNVTVYAPDQDEFFPVKHDFCISRAKDAADGVLDHGHIYLELAVADFDEKFDETGVV